MGLSRAEPAVRLSFAQGQPYGATEVVVGLVLGAFFISASQKWLKGAGEIEFADMKGADARKMLLMVRARIHVVTPLGYMLSCNLWLKNFCPPRCRSGS